MVEFIRYKDKDYPLYRKLCDPLYIDGTKTSVEDYPSVGKTGFLMGEPLSVGDAQKVPFFEIAMEGNKPVGLIRADLLSNTFEEEHELDWNQNSSPDVRKSFADGNNYELGVIVVAEEMRGRGLSGEMLKHLESFVKERGKTHLFSWVPERPENIPSKIFHLKNRFQIVAVYSSAEGFGFKDYRCNLFCKTVS